MRCSLKARERQDSHHAWGCPWRYPLVAQNGLTSRCSLVPASAPAVRCVSCSRCSVNGCSLKLLSGVSCRRTRALCTNAGNAQGLTGVCRLRAFACLQGYPSTAGNPAETLDSEPRLHTAQSPRQRQSTPARQATATAAPVAQASENLRLAQPAQPNASGGPRAAAAPGQHLKGAVSSLRQHSRTAAPEKSTAAARLCRKNGRGLCFRQRCDSRLHTR